MSLIFKKREEKALEVMRERNRRYLEEMEEQEQHVPGQDYAFKTGPSKYDENGEEYVPEEELDFEKGDLFAIIVSALMVFWPLLLFFGICLVLVCVWISRT